MRLLAVLIAAQVLGSAAVTTAATGRPTRHAREWSIIYLEAEQIVRHFERRDRRGIPRFDTVPSDGAYVDGEVDRVVLLVAHLEEAWSEAKRTSDKESTAREGAPGSSRPSSEPGHEARVLRERRRVEPGAASGLAASSNRKCHAGGPRLLLP